METLAVIDFETTGLSPDYGARATEIAAVLIRDGCVIGRYQSLMNTGARIPRFIEELTGITNAMVQQAPKAAIVMQEVAAFVGDTPLVAHNSSFDKRFWDDELARVSISRAQEFACSMLVARRVYPDAPNHKLGTLVNCLKLPVAGRYHRALADAEMTAGLLFQMERDLIRRYQIQQMTHGLLREIQKTSKHQLDSCVSRLRKHGQI